MDDVIGEWRATRDDRVLVSDTDLLDATPIVAESTLKQGVHNVLDNALEAAASTVRLRASVRDGWVRIEVEDDGPGFTPGALEDFGKPYNSTKGRVGGGLGLFLVVNVLRKLGGAVAASNLPDGGARVAMRFPLSALEITRNG